MTRLLLIFLISSASYACGTEEQCQSGESLKITSTDGPKPKQGEMIDDGLDGKLDDRYKDEYVDYDYYYSDELEDEYEYELENELEGELKYELDGEQEVIEWQEFTNSDFWVFLGCDEIFKQILPIHNQSTWMLLRGVYHGIVGNSHSSIYPLSHESGLRIPFNVSHASGKGRGVFATSFVKKGDLVWNSRQTAQFSAAAGYREFLVSISRGLACDVSQWAYVKDLNTGYDGELLDQAKDEDAEVDLVISIDLDEGILINDGEHRFDQFESEDEMESYSDVQNIGCMPEVAELSPGGCNKNLFALRDIMPGEELLCSYGDFAFGSGWKEFGL